MKLSRYWKFSDCDDLGDVEHILRLPPKLHEAAMQRHIYTAEALIAYMQADPIWVAKVMGWEIGKAHRKIEALKERLSGYVLAVFINPPANNPFRF